MRPVTAALHREVDRLRRKGFSADVALRVVARAVARAPLAARCRVVRGLVTEAYARRFASERRSTWVH